MKTLLALALLAMLPACGSKTDAAVADAVQDSTAPDAVETPRSIITPAPQPATAPVASQPAHTAPASEPTTTTSTTTTTTVVVVNNPPPEPVVEERVSLQDIIGWPRAYWPSSFENTFIEQCIEMAVPAMSSYTLGYNYCICSTVIHEKMTTSAQDYLDNFEFYNDEFLRVGGPEFCVEQAYEM